MENETRDCGRGGTQGKEREMLPRYQCLNCPMQHVDRKQCKKQGNGCFKAKSEPTWNQLSGQAIERYVPKNPMPYFKSKELPFPYKEPGSRLLFSFVCFRFCFCFLHLCHQAYIPKPHSLVLAVGEMYTSGALLCFCFCLVLSVKSVHVSHELVACLLCNDALPEGATTYIIILLSPGVWVILVLRRRYLHIG